jgi:peptidoglycan/xylan/chitin deacetylase (PgdA/CDA1 family)
MSKFFRRYAVIFAVILAGPVFCSANTDAYAQPSGAEAQSTASESEKIAYITLDDGPSRSTTPINLDTLKRYGVKATFFVLPRSGVDDLYKRIVEEGHAIGNHSYSHDYNYLYSSTENFKKDVVRAGDFICQKTGCTPTVFRFPGGSMGRSKAVVKARADILTGLGYNYYDWDISTADTDPNLRTYGNEEHIVSLLTDNILKNTQNRKKLIILMHDTSTYSAKALPGIIEGLREQGYAFGVLSGPGARLTRGEFIVLMMHACGIAPDENPADNFVDAGGAYYAGYLAAAKRLGISGGVGDNLFAPEKEITRQEMFTLLYNALQVIGRLPQGDSGKTLSDFTDAEQIDPWAVEAMALLVETGIVSGSAGEIHPAGTATRAEMEQVLYNLPEEVGD